MNNIYILTLSAIASSALAADYPAGTIGTYVWEGTGSGSIGSTSFQDAAFTLTSVGYAHDLLPYYNGDDELYFYGARTESTITIEGLGSYTIGDGSPNSGLSIGINLINNSVELRRSGFGGVYELFTLSDPSLHDWDLFSRDISPISGIGTINNWGGPFPGGLNFPIETSGGVIEFDSSLNSPLTFSATIVPSPSTILAAGLTGLFSTRRRRNA